MNIKILSKDKDPMGAAILDYQKSERVGRLPQFGIVQATNPSCLLYFP